MFKQEESSFPDLSLSNSTAISTTSILSQIPVNFEKENYFRKKKVDFSNTFKIHKLINEALRTLDFLIKEVEHFPLIVKLFLEVKISQTGEEKNIIIEIPQKKCFKIWEKDLIEKTKMKIEVSLLDFTSYITQPFDVNILQINSFEVKIASFFSFFAEGRKFLNCFKTSLGSKFKYILPENKQADLLKLKSINEMINFYEENKLEKDILIFFAESVDKNFIWKDEKRIIGPINIIKSNKTMDINEKAFRYKNYKDFYSIFFYDSDTQRIYHQNDEEAKYKIVESICAYCKRKINIEEDFYEHSLFCKHAFLTNDKENKSNDESKNDIINGSIFFKENEQHLCKKEHLQCYKKFFKPFKNEIYKRYEKINMVADKNDEPIKKEAVPRNFSNPKDSLLYDFIQYRTNNSKTNVNDVYKFVSDSPIFMLRNDAYVRFNENKLNDLICEFTADSILSEIMSFPTINLKKPAKIYNMKDNPQKCLELFEKITRTSSEEKTKTFFFQNYSSLKMKSPSEKIKNPYNFTGLIKCDLEINKIKLNDDMKKKCPILPFNIWLKFFDSTQTKKVHYKTRKYIFESANSYTLLSDHLFYLLENDFYSLRRIEDVCEFEACHENLYFLDDKINDIHSGNAPKNEKKKQEAELIKNFSSIFVDNLFRKSYTKEFANSSYKNSFYDNFCLYSKIKDFKMEGLKLLELSPKKSADFKYFRILSFIYLSYMNMLTLHSALGFILNGGNKLNKILSKDENNNKTIERFNMFYFSCSRIIVRYTCVNEEVKKKKQKVALNSTLSFNPNGYSLYKVRNLVDAYFHVRPFFTYCNENPLESNLYYEARRLADCPLDFCKYDFQHIPFAPIQTDFTLFNKLIFHDGYHDKNDNCVKKMLTNLYNRYKKEHPSVEFKFSEIFELKKEDFKKKMYQSMQYKMNFDNYGVKWNLDHKIPVFTLKEKKECVTKEELAQVWKHNNIIPMMIEENQKKSKNFE